MQITIDLGLDTPAHEIVEYIGSLAIGMPTGAVITMRESPAEPGAAATAPPHPLVAAVMSADDQAKSRPYSDQSRKKRGPRGLRPTSKQETARKRAIVIELVACPNCGAERGDYCRNPGGKNHYNLHTARWLAYSNREAKIAEGRKEARAAQKVSAGYFDGLERVEPAEQTVPGVPGVIGQAEFDDRSGAPAAEVVDG